ncbi:hypothetical protein [Leptospira phage LE3]|uniref:Uncharacterized protein n=1 Tax=Leptospira phage LE3 TaxID=2041382 RepID=A0A343LE80_9CAUD|nr:hypothetical protein HWB33_gp04 [Leptospira phage LE3]ATN94990.1 hypothetical protein [Leptospira phage LE3]
MNFEEGKLLLDMYKQTENALSVNVKIGWEQARKITVEDLIKKRNAPSNQIKKSFDDVLKYYLEEEDFQKYVINGKKLNEPTK